MSKVRRKASEKPRRGDFANGAAEWLFLKIKLEKEMLNGKFFYDKMIGN